MKTQNLYADPYDPLDDDRDELDPMEFSETARGEAARHRWARWYDTLDGAPENDDDR